jgi:hypothetical protein
MLGCDNWLYEYGKRFGEKSKRTFDNNDCDHPEPMGWIAVLYFVVFCVLGSQILLNLFIGVIATAMEEASMNGEESDVINVSPSLKIHLFSIFRFRR